MCSSVHRLHLSSFHLFSPGLPPFQRLSLLLFALLFCSPPQAKGTPLFSAENGHQTEDYQERSNSSSSEVTGSTYHHFLNFSLCCTTVQSEADLVLVLFVLAITLILTTLFIFVFCCQNECTCRKLAAELGDNLAEAGFGAESDSEVSREQRREYSLQKSRHQLAMKEVPPMLTTDQEDDEDEEDGDCFRLLVTAFTRLWPFDGSNRPLRRNRSCSPLFSCEDAE